MSDGSMILPSDSDWRPDIEEILNRNWDKAEQFKSEMEQRQRDARNTMTRMAINNVPPSPRQYTLQTRATDPHFRVLVVEDDPFTAHVHSMLLKSVHEVALVTVARTKSDAFSILSDLEMPFHLALIDMCLSPSTDKDEEGLEISDRLVSCGKRGRLWSPPLRIAVTAHQLNHDWTTFDLVLPKPITRAHVAVLMQAACV